MVKLCYIISLPSSRVSDYVRLSAMDLQFALFHDYAPSKDDFCPFFLMVSIFIFRMNGAF